MKRINIEGNFMMSSLLEALISQLIRLVDGGMEFSGDIAAQLGDLGKMLNIKGIGEVLLDRLPKMMPAHDTERHKVTVTIEDNKLMVKVACDGFRQTTEIDTELSVDDVVDLFVRDRYYGKYTKLVFKVCPWLAKGQTAMVKSLLEDGYGMTDVSVEIK